MGKPKTKAKPGSAPPLNAFDRRANETDPAWKAFLCYRNMGEGRTLDKARKELGRREGYMRQLEEWSSDHEWVLRVRAWDDAEARRKVVGEDPLDAALGLTLKQKLFAEAYVTNGGVGVRAAKTAGYNSEDYNTLAAIASENLKNPKVRRYLDQLMRESSMSADEVLFQLSEIARGDMRTFIARDTNELKVHPKGFLIKKIEVKTETEFTETGKVQTETIKLELYSRAEALQMLGRYHKLFTDKVEVEDWRSKAINLIKSGAVTYEDVVEVYGDESLAAALFRQAGVAVYQASSTD
jgi:phage terminase small subunit